MLCREVALQLQEAQASLATASDAAIMGLPKLTRKYVLWRRQLLYAYTLNATFYLYLHAKGVPLRTHPCTTALVRLQRVRARSCGTYDECRELVCGGDRDVKEDEWDWVLRYATLRDVC